MWSKLTPGLTSSRFSKIRWKRKASPLSFVFYSNGRAAIDLEHMELRSLRQTLLKDVGI